MTTDGIRQAVVTARQEYSLSVRNRWAFALAGLFALFAGFLVVFSGSRAGASRFGFEIVVVSLVSLATYLLPLAALVYGYDTVVGADNEGWLDVVFALPASRYSIVFGIYAGRATTLAAATLVGFGIVGGILVSQGGFSDPALYSL
ncbi:MAG: ABC transporter permease, partial [Halobacteria archaeon]|nr:ABC transporter permease [Halobacteria archaeon]